MDIAASATHISATDTYVRDADHQHQFSCHQYTNLTPLLVVFIAAVLPPHQQGYLRSAGSVGEEVYEEIWAQQQLSAYVECYTSLCDGPQTKGTCRHAPIVLPISAHAIESFDDVNVLVVSHRHLDGGSGISINAPITSIDIGPVRRLKYLGNPNANTLSFRGSSSLGAPPPMSSVSRQNQQPTALSGYGWRQLLSIEFCDVDHVQELTDGTFLGNFNYLSSIDLSPFRSITKVGNYFLAGCCSLTSIDLAPLNSVVTVGNCFMRNCTSLASIDLSPMSTLTNIGTYFMDGCASLSAIDISSLGYNTSVGGFLRGCTALPAIDLSPLSNISTIGDDFLSGCISLTEIDLAPLRNVTVIKSSFMSGCISLAAIDLSAFSQVNRMGHLFLYDCRSLATIDLRPLGNVTEVGSEFLSRCSSLREQEGCSLLRRAKVVVLRH